MRQLDEKIFQPISNMFGCSVSMAKVLLMSFLLMYAIGGYLAVDAAFSLSEQFSQDYLSSEALDNISDQDQEGAQKALEERKNLPVLIPYGASIPLSASRKDAQALCDTSLTGDKARAVGWLWLENDMGCRRMSEAAR